MGTAAGEEEERAWRNEPEGALSRLRKWVGVRDLPNSSEVIDRMPEPLGCRCHDCLSVDRKNLRLYLWQLQNAVEDTVDYNRFLEEEIDRTSRFLMEAREPVWLPITCTRKLIDEDGEGEVEVIDLLSDSSGDEPDDDVDDMVDGDVVGGSSQTRGDDEPENGDPDWVYTGQGEDRKRSPDFSEYGKTIDEVISESVKEWMRYVRDRKGWSDGDSED